MNNIEKLNQLAEGRQSSWLKEANERKKNSSWMSRSVEFAFSLLKELRYQNMSQRDLAEKMGVSAQYVNKIVKGRENLSLETICKIEKALGISLFQISTPIHYTTEICRTTYNVPINFHKKKYKSSKISLSNTVTYLEEKEIA